MQSAAMQNNNISHGFVHHAKFPLLIIGALLILYFGWKTSIHSSSQPQDQSTFSIQSVEQVPINERQPLGQIQGLDCEGIQGRTCDKDNVATPHRVKVYAREVGRSEEIHLGTLYTESIVGRTAPICNGSVDNGFVGSSEELDFDQLIQDKLYEISVWAVNIDTAGRPIEPYIQLNRSPRAMRGCAQEYLQVIADDCSSQEEVCNGIDDTCDGIVDEGCDCVDREVQVRKDQVGVCQVNQEICIGGKRENMPETVVPSQEICDGKDNDCNGEIDDGIVCGCGDGERDPGEECDDGNTLDGDGCSNGCRIERNWKCSVVWPSRCQPDLCNDGRISRGETDVDCGGPCAPCSNYDRCINNADCKSQNCVMPTTLTQQEVQEAQNKQQEVISQVNQEQLEQNQVERDLELQEEVDNTREASEPTADEVIHKDVTTTITDVDQAPAMPASVKEETTDPIGQPIEARVVQQENCEDGSDNDGDGRIDCEDSDCIGQTICTRECASDRDCNDGTFCNGSEICDTSYTCQKGTAPCSTRETCNESRNECVNKAFGNGELVANTDNIVSDDIPDSDDSRLDNYLKQMSTSRDTSSMSFTFKIQGNPDSSLSLGEKIVRWVRGVVWGVLGINRPVESEVSNQEPVFETSSLSNYGPGTCEPKRISP